MRAGRRGCRILTADASRAGVDVGAVLWEAGVVEARRCAEHGDAPGPLVHLVAERLYAMPTGELGPAAHALAAFEAVGAALMDETLLDAAASIRQRCLAAHEAEIAACPEVPS